MYKQCIIVRKDLNMSYGKFAAQVSHGSEAFFIEMIKNNLVGEVIGKNIYRTGCIDIDKDLYDQWIDGDFTKCILQAKNKNHLLKAKTMAEELGMKENEDFWLIYDLCRTELEPEEDGRTLTVISFRPMNSEVIDKVGRKYQLYK